MEKLNCIWLIDDETITNYLHKLILQQMKLAENIVVLKHGAEALNLVKAKLNESATKPDFPELILLDINMPVMDGLQFLGELNKLNYWEVMQSRIVMVSSSQRAEDIEESIRLGASNYMTKPLTEDKIRKMLAQSF
jgi:CheY-like chemotaxis protein